MKGFGLSFNNTEGRYLTFAYWCQAKENNNFGQWLRVGVNVLIHLGWS